MMKKRILLMAMAACLAIACFTACSKDEDKDKGNPTSKPTASATAKPTASATAAPTATQSATAETTPGTDETAKPTGDQIDAVVFRFDNKDDYDSGEGAFANTFQGHNMMGTTIEATKEDGLIMEIEGNDPYVYYTGFDPFELSEYPYMKICIKNPTPATAFEMFFVPAGAVGASAGDLFTGNSITAGDTEFKTYVFDIAAKNGAAFMDRSVEMLRLDCVNLDNAAGSDYQFNMKYIAFFKTEAEANAYN